MRQLRRTEWRRSRFHNPSLCFGHNCVAVSDNGKISAAVSAHFSWWPWCWNRSGCLTLATDQFAGHRLHWENEFWQRQFAQSCLATPLSRDGVICSGIAGNCAKQQTLRAKLSRRKEKCIPGFASTRRLAQKLWRMTTFFFFCTAAGKRSGPSLSFRASAYSEGSGSRFPRSGSGSGAPVRCAARRWRDILAGYGRRFRAGCGAGKNRVAAKRDCCRAASGLPKLGRIRDDCTTVAACSIPREKIARALKWFCFPALGKKVFVKNHASHATVEKCTPF